MNAYTALIVAGVIFSIVSLLHLLRLFYKSEVVFAGKSIPMWVSVVGFVVSILLAIWMFLASGNLCLLQ